MNHAVSLMIVINTNMNVPLLDTARVFFKSLFDSNVVIKSMRLSVVMDRDTHELLQVSVACRSIVTDDLYLLRYDEGYVSRTSLGQGHKLIDDPLEAYRVTEQVHDLVEAMIPFIV